MIVVQTKPDLAKMMGREYGCLGNGASGTIEDIVEGNKTIIREMQEI